MKKILIIVVLLFGYLGISQQYHDKGAKFENATNEGDTITVNTRIPIIDEFGLINYYVDVADLLALNPAPVLEWGNITGTLSNQTDLQGALNSKADQSDLIAHTSNGNIHFTQSAISITESQVSDLKDYLRGDVNDTNGANKLTLGSLEVAGQTTLQNGLNLTSIPVGTSDNILTINGTGDVEQRVFSLGDIDIANESGVSQFPVGLGDQLRIQGSGDTSISFDGITNTININSTPGSGGGGAVTSFNGRDGAVVSQAGDYSTAMVNENTNLYFTEPRVRSTPLTGLTVANTPISSTNTFIQALGRLQGQINNSSNMYLRKDISDTKQGNLFMESGDLTVSRDGVAVVEITGLDDTGGVVGTDTDHDLLLRRNNAEIIRLLSSGANITGNLNVSGTARVGGNVVWHEGNFSPSNYLPLSGGTMSGNINFSSASTGISKSGNIIMRNNGTITVLSSINDNILFRPNGDTNSVGEVAISTSGVISATGGNSTNWNTAFGWGNHANQGYITGSYTGFDSRYVSLTANEDVSGLKNFTGSTGRADFTGTAPQLRFTETDGTFNAKNSILIQDSNRFEVRLYSDDFSSQNTPFRITRSQTTPTEILLNAPTNVNSSLNVESDLTIDNPARIRFGSIGDLYESSGGVLALNLRSSDFTIYDNFSQRFSFGRTTGNFSATGEITATGGNSTQWNTAYGWGNHASAGYVPSSRLISTGNHLSGGGNLSANRSLTLTPTVDQWVLDSQGNQRMYFNSDAVGNNGIILKASAATQKLQYRDVNNNQVFTVDDSGSVVSSGSGSFGGRVSGSDALNANEFVTRQQVVPLSTQQTGVVRAIEAISSALTVDDGVYMEKGGVQYALTVPAGTFQQSGRGILDIEGIMEMSNITQNKTLLVYITFSQAGVVYNSDPMTFDLSTTDGGAFGHFKATLTSRMSAGYFFGKGIVTGSDSNGSITQGFVINPPTSLDFRESFTIRMRVNSTTGYNMVLIPFTVKVSDLPN